MYFTLLLSLFVLVYKASTRICYVRPDTSIPMSCPGQPCQTFELYAQHPDQCMIITGTSFVFLAGNHSLETSFSVRNVSSVSLKAASSLMDSKVLLSVSLLFESVENISVQGLTFVTRVSINDYHSDLSAFEFYDSNHIWVIFSTFRGNGKLNGSLARAILSVNSDINIHSFIFEGNTGDYGGAVSAFASNVTLNGGTFTSNQAVISGGAIYANQTAIVITGLTSIFTHNSAERNGGALMCENSTIRAFSECDSIYPISGVPGASTNSCLLYYAYNKAMNGSAISLFNNSVAVLYGLVVGGNNSADNGGVFYFSYSELILSASNSWFTGNSVRNAGGVIYISHGSLKLENGHNNHQFFNNSASTGGVLYLQSYSKITIQSNVTFLANYARNYGGVLYLFFSNFYLFSGGVFFISNRAGSNGGAVRISQGTFCAAYSNEDPSECGRALPDSFTGHVPRQLHFASNGAEDGGGLHSFESVLQISANFSNNTAKRGGALYVSGRYKAKFFGLFLTANTGSALYIFEGIVSMIETAIINGNVGSYGGGVYCEKSSLTFAGTTAFFSDNKANFGGAVHSLICNVTIIGETSFQHNLAHSNGGGFYALDTQITLLRGILCFSKNSADYGGAMYWTGTASYLIIYMESAELRAYHNYATHYGGAIFNEDRPTSFQCRSDIIEHLSDSVTSKFLPECFLGTKWISDLVGSIDIIIDSFNNSAGKDGNFLYGGLLNKCQMIFLRHHIAFKQGDTHLYEGIDTEIKVDNTYDISSKPYKLCFCESSNIEYNCSRATSFQVFRGQEFRVFLIAFNQVRATVPTPVRAVTAPTASLKLNQNLQEFSSDCIGHAYNLYSTVEQEELVLYADGGPCHDTGLARVEINITFYPCPHAFVQAGQQCVCEERLQVYRAECIIDKEVYITRRSSSRFWMSLLFINGSYQGLILYRTCPEEFCTNKNVNITLDNLDMACEENRSGVLCGKCNDGYSLLLGSSQCGQCSNVYLTLLIPFALAGFTLFVFLSFLRLTVATGMINSIIFYANIVQANKRILLPSSSRNILTVFLAWLNLDLGFETCFFDGMDAYVQTWLQLVFPVYIWTLVSFIIITSRHSIFLSKLIGHDPIAVLATLLLMSYTKILNIIIEVYSSVDLDYPNDNTVRVWLKDANVPYLESKHLFLTIVISIVLVVFFLPYTLLLLVGYKLYYFSGNKCFCGLRRIKPFLESYYAPYKIHTRYWTGFLLLVRCVLYVVFSYNSLGEATKSLLAINITLTAIVVVAWLSVSIYKIFFVNIIEALVFLNLITLSNAALVSANSPELAYSLVGMVFAIFIGVILYHFYLQYCTKLTILLKLKAKLSNFFNSIANLFVTKVPASERSLSGNHSAVPSIHDPYKIVSKTVIELREPLLDPDV